MSQEQSYISVEQDRREYFRVDDTVSLSFQLVPESKLQARLDCLDKGLDGEFTVMANLAVISQEMSGTLRKIEGESPDTARYLKSLDNKIDLLGRAFVAWSSDLSDQPVNNVNLSASGIAFQTPEPIAVGAHMELKLLLPSYTGLLIFGEVVACEKVNDPPGDAPFRVRVNFTHLREKDRDLLIRHVLKRQSEMLRKRREHQESSTDS
jgi:hypothetical protein